MAQTVTPDLDYLKQNWGGFYEISSDCCRADRRDGQGSVEARNAEELLKLMRADYAGLPVGKLRPLGRYTAELRDSTRRAVDEWRLGNPQGTYVEMVGALWPQFPYQEYDVVLRGILFAVDRHDARQVTGVTGSPG